MGGAGLRGRTERWGGGRGGLGPQPSADLVAFSDDGAGVRQKDRLRTGVSTLHHLDPAVDSRQQGLGVRSTSRVGIPMQPGACSSRIPPGAGIRQRHQHVPERPAAPPHPPAPGRQRPEQRPFPLVHAACW